MKDLTNKLRAVSLVVTMWRLLQILVKGLINSLISLNISWPTTNDQKFLCVRINDWSYINIFNKTSFKSIQNNGNDVIPLLPKNASLLSNKAVFYVRFSHLRHQILKELFHILNLLLCTGSLEIISTGENVQIYTKDVQTKFKIM